MEIRTRMAPSPTGKLHLGTAYAALWPYLFARSQKGKFILRIEDTDAERSTKEYTTDIIGGLKWLGLEWDEGPFYQMERLEIFKQAAKRLVNEGKAYLCFCTKEELEEERKLQITSKLPQVYSGKCRQLTPKEIDHKKQSDLGYVVRYKLPDKRGLVEFEDLVHGKVSIESKLLGDMVIVRQNGVPLYNFVVVVDDREMKITHVIRGDDHLSNTPKQILFFEALNSDVPEFAHIPIIMEQDRSGKLSKRTGSTGIERYKDEGYLPEAIVNYLASLGLALPDDKGILSKDELIKYFDIKKMIDHPAAWNHQKLDWINGEYIRAMSDEELANRLSDFLVDHPAKEKIRPLVPLVKERIKKLSDFIPLTNFLFEGSEYDIKIFNQLKVKDTDELLEEIENILNGLAKPWESKEFEKIFRDLADKKGLLAGDIFQLIRVAFSGQLVTPPLFESMIFVGEDETIKRIKQAREFLNK